MYFVSFSLHARMSPNTRLFFRAPLPLPDSLLQYKNPRPMCCIGQLFLCLYFALQMSSQNPYNPQHMPHESLSGVFGLWGNHGLLTLIIWSNYAASESQVTCSATFLAEFRKSLILLGQIIRNKANMVDVYEKGDQWAAQLTLFDAEWQRLVGCGE